jgi:hypothetical protein
MKTATTWNFCGQSVNNEQIGEIKEIIETFPKLSRAELANTLCELFSWKRPTGKLKNIECRQFLEKLCDNGLITLPPCRKQYANRGEAKPLRSKQTNEPQRLEATLKQLMPLLLIKVENEDQRRLWYEYIDRYHYLGYRQPFGAQLRYFIKSGATDDLLGCFQFSSPAWRMAPRDQWIGWNDGQRKGNLQKIINNSRFLIFPWVQVKNLASSALSLAARTVPGDWQRSYGKRPVLMETLVDTQRFQGTCYKAANWVHVGQTTGRGRMDRAKKRQGAAVKEIYIYPLTVQFRKELAGI